MQYCCDPEILTHETEPTAASEEFERPEFGWETVVHFKVPYAYVVLPLDFARAISDKLDYLEIDETEIDEETNEDARETYVGYAFQKLGMGPEGPDTEIEWVDEATLIIRHSVGLI